MKKSTQQKEVQQQKVQMPPDPPRCPWCNDEPLEVTTGGVVVTRLVCPKCKNV